MKIIQMRTDDLIPYGRNQKKHDEKQVRNVANSIKRFGWQQPIVVDSNNVVVIGHCRLMAAQKLGLSEVPVTVADDLSEDEIRQLRIADNKTNESPWDVDQLAIDAAELSFDGFDFDFELPKVQQEDETYTATVNIPQYEPTGEDVRLNDLFDKDKAEQLIEEIDESDAPDDVKEFLRLAAYRHVVFNYKNIAQYYATASEQVQDMMESSALVIIDIDNAIANGFARLKDEIDELLQEDCDE